MNRLRAAALLVTTAAITAGALAPAATAATPSSNLHADMGWVKTVEARYAAAHHVGGKAFSLRSGQSTKVGTYRVVARRGMTIATKLGARGKTAGFCSAITYPAALPKGHFAYYDSILKVTSYNATSYAVGGACLSAAQHETALRAAMHADLHSGTSAEEMIITNGAPSYGKPFTATYGHPASLAKHAIVTASKGDTVEGITNDYAGGYCLVVTNPASNLPGHAMHYDSVTGYTHGGGWGYGEETGACAIPPASY